MSNRSRIRGMSATRILFTAPLVTLMLCVTQHFATAQKHVVNGKCGAANGVAVSAAPSADLCASGTASAVEGSGPWSWKCNSSRGGSSASCSASVESAGGATTAAGVPLPIGWTLQQSDTFGTDGNITNYTQLHAEYCEGQWYNVDSSGCLVRLPNVVINNEQETYEHFETSIVFFTDHLEIQGRGQPNGVIQSAEMVAKYTPLSFCVEARYQIPSTPGSWPGFWWGASTGVNNTASEIDVEQPVTLSGNQGVRDVSLHNHPTEGTITIANPDFSAQYMTYYSSIDFSAAPHYYTVCYNNNTSTITKWIDGGLIYTATNWRWAGPNPTTIINLAVGGEWPGDLSNPSAYVGNLAVYSIAYYAP